MSRRPLLPAIMLLIACLLAPSLRADQLSTNSSLRWVPDSIAFYGSLMRMEQQWQIFENSRAFQRIKQMPVVQMGLMQFRQQWESEDGDMVELRQFIENPENAGLIQLARELVSTEFFICGDQSLGDLIYKLNKANQASTLAQLQTLSGDDNGDGEEEAKRRQIAMMIEAIEDSTVPNLVIGFRIADGANALREIDRLEKHLRDEWEDEPEVVERLKRTASENGEFLQLVIDEAIIPWDEIGEDSDLDAQQLEQLRDALQGKQLYISLGVVEGYLQLSVTEGADPLALFQTDDVLIDSPHMAKVREVEDRAITSVGYVSGDFLRRISRPKEDMQQLGAILKAVVGQTDLDRELVSQMQADVNELVNDIAELIPEQGDAIAVEYLTNSGYEGYQQTWAENKFLDGSRPLEVLRHVGDPLIVCATRSVVPENATQTTVKWVKRAAYYAQRVASEKEVDEEKLELMRQFSDQMAPLAEQWVKITETHIEAAFDDGESAFVVDAKLKPREQWHPMMPPADEPLPMLEFASLTRVSDAAELEKGIMGYTKVAQEALATIKKFALDHAEQLNDELEGPAQMAPQMIQGFQLPIPVRRDVDDGRIYSLMTLQLTGLDATLAPSLGWSDDMMVVALSPETVERFLGHGDVPTPFQESADKPLASATYVNFAGLVEQFRPWISYGMNVAAQQEGNQMVLMFIPQVDAVLEVMACFKSMSSVTYTEEDSLVTFYRAELRDLEESTTATP